MVFIEYDRQKAVNYAIEFANKRNPKYYDFSFLGGDCTNFCSQCLFQGAPIMNLTKNFGWYYFSLQNRTPSWTGVEFFYNFLINNLGKVEGQNYLNFSSAIGNGEGPFGIEVSKEMLNVGDFIQLGNSSKFYHTLFIVGFYGNVPLIATHSNDQLFRRLDSYAYQKIRFIKILGARKKTAF